MTNDPPTEARTRRRRFRVTLGMLLLAIIPLAIGLAWLANLTRAQRRAIATIEKLGGVYKFDYEFVDADPSSKSILNPRPPGPAWLHRVIGDAPFRNVVSVMLVGDKVHDSDLAIFENLPRVRWVMLFNTRSITDAGLVHLRGNREIRELNIYRHKAISDAGLAHLRGLTKLEVLQLDHSRVTDAGLDSLSGMKELRELDIDGTSVSNAGLLKLRSLPKLTQVFVQDSRSTHEGYDELKKSLPKVHVSLGSRPGSWKPQAD